MVSLFLFPPPRLDALSLPRISSSVIYAKPGNCAGNHQVTSLSAAAIALQPPSSRRSTDSSPSHSHTQSHSQMSRNSSRKSNNSVNCKLDGKRRIPSSVQCLPRSFEFLSLNCVSSLGSANCFIFIFSSGALGSGWTFLSALCPIVLIPL